MIYNKRNKAVLFIGSVLIFGFIVSCKSPNKFSDKYPSFAHANEFKSSGTVSLNNFNSINDKNGVEYLCSAKGDLLEVKFWKNNMLHGKAVSYSVNKNIKMFGNYVNDTLVDYYYQIDSINGQILTYIEKIKSSLGVSDNQIISFKEGKIDNNKSYYYTIKKTDPGIYRISLHGRIDFPNCKFFIAEIDKDEFVFDNEAQGEKIDLVDKGTSFNYLVKDKLLHKFLSGTISNYRYLSDDELKEYDAKKGALMERMLYFKYPVGE